MMWSVVFCRYKRKYLNRSVSRLKQFGLKQNEAYALLVPDKAWEVDRKALEINRKLGEGAFGTVYGADYFSGNLVKTCTPVAVKTLHDGAEGEEKVSLWGVCTKKLIGIGTHWVLYIVISYEFSSLTASQLAATNSIMIQKEYV